MWSPGEDLEVRVLLREASLAYYPVARFDQLLGLCTPTYSI
jgi:hypothetical protein